VQGLDDLSSNLRKLIANTDEAPSDLLESITAEIKRDRRAAYDTVLPMLQSSGGRREEMLVYVWALGMTGLEEGAAPIFDAWKSHGKQSSEVTVACANALAAIGGPDAGRYILAQLDDTKDEQARFELFSRLGELKDASALPRMIEILKVDPEQFYWKPIFVFGKMGDAAVPFLLSNIANDERNVRINAISILGSWLIAPEAIKPLRERYWKETDPEVRRSILGALQRCDCNLETLAGFCRQVIDKEQDESLRSLARGTLEMMDDVKKQLLDYRQRKQVDKARFDREFVTLYGSMGQEGALDVLPMISSAKNEPQLKKLRARILRRDSDEALYDYQRVNAVILRNRAIERNELSQAGEQP